MINGKKIAAIITDRFHNSELWDPQKALEKAGAKVTVIGVEERQKKEGVLDHVTAYLPDESKPAPKDRQQIDMVIDEAKADDFDALLLAGGGSPERLRAYPKVVEFIQNIYWQKKPIASICHAALILISAGIVKGKTMTCVPSIGIDLSNAGAIYIDRPVVVDNGIVTSRTPADMDQFVKATLEVFDK
jgi:protease I